MPGRPNRTDPGEVDAALRRVLADKSRTDDLRLLTKHFLAELSAVAPGRSVEVRVPPYGATQCVTGTRHARGTPPAVVETDPLTWVLLATGRLDWADACRTGRLSASGERSDLSPLLPLPQP